MSFRKRNVGISSDPARIDPRNLAAAGKSTQPTTPPSPPLPGVRPSPLDGRPTTSTGTSTLDGLLAGHGGQALGTSILIGENGTTDYAGVLLRYCAAEGLVQGHHLHIVGVPEQWGRELPGLAGGKAEKDVKVGESATTEKMKIAWRYEGLGQFGAGSNTPERTSLSQVQDGTGPSIASPFCHSFDLTKRLVHPAKSTMNFLQLDHRPGNSPFGPTLSNLAVLLAGAPPGTVHRVVIPSLLSPALYPPHSSKPEYVLKFLHGLRALLASYQNQMIVILSLPLSLYSRSSGLVRWIELLSDGVIELSPLPHSADPDVSNPKPGSGNAEEPPQGLLTLHRLPIFHDRGSGVNTTGEDWAFSLSRKKFSITPFSLPPIEGDIEAQQGVTKEQKVKKSDMEF